MPPSDCIHSAARKAWMIHATAKEQRHHRWHSLTLLGCIACDRGARIADKEREHPPVYPSQLWPLWGKQLHRSWEKEKKAKTQIRRGRHAILTGLVNRNPNGPLD
ncbi:hypothetical protein QC762_603438 [Podospora pseudocomata]|uniref:Uncharacterized protein n=1 Tax=Podospora pseudocomata TaxID=2093779 RepID=A0ABR0G6X9_9PEZI|nr:hypothetical protein QC762_603438 [Podospora pseudocomata]